MASTDFSLFAASAVDTRINKSPNALRTISEASEILDVPQHVLRFWETKFSQIKPLKRNGGRRFYRPQDLDILQQIKHMLYNQGYTIKGAKKAIDEFIHAKADRNVSHAEWMETIQPANVNDNVATDEPDMLAELAQALAEPEEAALPTANQFPRETLETLRYDLSRARDILKLRLLASAV